MLELVTTSLAVFTVIMTLRLLLPFAFPLRLMPVVVAATAYGVTRLPAACHPAVQAAAVAGLVAIIHRVAVGQEPEPWSLRNLAARIAVPRKPKQAASRGPVGHRIPRL